MRGRSIGWWLIALLLASWMTSSAHTADSGSASLQVIEGRVTGIGERIAEGDLTVVSLDVAVGEDSMTILLAPRSTLDEIGFEIEVGDIVRARTFTRNEKDACCVQKVMNLSRNQMVRLRTLRSEPLWDSTGRWQGGMGNRHRAGEQSGTGRQHRGGR